MLFRIVGATVMLLSLTCPFVASADPAPAKIIRVPNAPVEINRCTYDVASPNAVWRDLVVLRNRTTHPLLSAEVRFQMFDDEGPVGESVLTIEPHDQVLASGDSTSYSSISNNGETAPSSTVRFATCRILSATFTHGRKWSYGDHYQDTLLPVDSPESYAPDTSSSHLIEAPVKPLVVVKLGQAWVSHPPNSAVFVHVRVTISSAQPITISPGQFHLTMALGNGASEEYDPLQQPAPRVLRGGLLTFTGDPNELAPSIAPTDDFGAIGQMSLQPNVPVTTVLTYQADLPGGSGTVQAIRFIP